MKIKVILHLIFFNAILLANQPNIFINEFLASNASVNFDPDFYSFFDWIEIYNSEDTTVNIGGFYITDDLSNPSKYQIPINYAIEPNGFSIIWANGKNLFPGDSVVNPEPSSLTTYVNSLHSNFKLNKYQEEIALFNTDGVLVDSITYQNQITDISFGRSPDGSGSFFFFGDPTPLGPNSVLGFQDTTRSLNPQFSHLGGAYNQSLSITLLSQNLSSSIYYTLDGSNPNIFSLQYSSPIEIHNNTVLKAINIDSTSLPSRVITNTYFINETFDLPAISISIDPEFLWDDEIGIYVEGGSEDVYGWNCFQNWERPANIEFFNTNGEIIFNNGVGLKIHGSSSRALPQKSFAIFARNKYGSNYMNYKFFEDKNIIEHKSLILRNSGYDWRKTLIRDGLSHTLVADNLDVDYQSYQPSAVYLNGEYWGILNIREKLNEHYIKSNYNINAENLELIDIAGSIRAIFGDTTDYTDLLYFVENEDLNISENYNYVKNIIDVDNYLNYQIIEIFYGNHDWPGNNVKIWKSNLIDNKYRWILNDLDFAFNGVDWMSGTSFNSIDWATDIDSPLPQYNPSWSTLLFRSLLENENFKNDFIQRSVVFLNTVFDDQKVLNVIDSLKTNIEVEIPKHINKWADEVDFWGNQISVASLDTWHNEIEVLEDFANNRSDYMLEHIRSHFGLDSLAQLVININDYNAGIINVSGIDIENLPYSASSFMSTPLKIRARPFNGFNFSFWNTSSGPISNLDSLTLSIFSDTSITAVFEHVNQENIIVNEIYYNSELDFNTGTWVELYNKSDSAINLFNWVLKNSNGEEFIIEHSALIDEGGFFIICKDTTLFKSFFPNIQNYTGNINFDFDNEADTIEIINQSGVAIDQISYGNNFSLPDMYENYAFSLELKNTELDNDVEINWRVSHTFGGSPGVDNNSIITSNLYINEFLASNDFILPDENGEFEDWIEIYNGSDQIISLAGLFLTDDLENPTLWKIPLTNLDQTMVPPKDFILFWADADTIQGINHCDFKLNKNGEQIGIFLSDNEETICIDSLSFGSQTENISFGRTSDGDSLWQFFENPTPEESNLVLAYDSLSYILNNYIVFQNYPNPFNPTTKIKYGLPEDALVTIKIFDIMGRNIRTLVHTKQKAGYRLAHWDATNDFGGSVSAGMYIYTIQAGEFRSTKKMLYLK